MTEKNKIETRLETLGSELRGQESVVGDVMSKINAMPPVTRSENGPRGAMIWRFVMNRYTKIAAVAAVLAIAAIVTFMAMEKATPMAYALEQTIAAIQNVRFVHLKVWQTADDEPMHIWMEYDNNAEPIRIRMSMPTWKSPKDGPKEVLWQDNVAQVLLVRKKTLLTITEKKMVGEFRGIASQLDAGQLFKRMVTGDKTAGPKVEVTKPSGDGEPIVVTSTMVKDNISYVQMFHIDPVTKLVTLTQVTSVDSDGKETVKFKMECDYTRPETDVFAIQVPEGTVSIDNVANVVGIPQGEMTDEQAATETVSQFWQALIAADYQKAGSIYSGLPADKMKEVFGRFKFIRLVSMEEPIVDAVSRSTHGYRVKCVIEMEYNGKTGQQPFGPLVRKGDDQAHPDNWVINGGI
jgi:hypothetical protein